MHDGYRLVQICAIKAETLDLIYSFDKDYELINLCLTVTEQDEIQSITSMYSYAYLYENEIRELFGVNIIEINVDFEGKLYQIKDTTPFNTTTQE